jgi:hypothetical protein
MSGLQCTSAFVVQFRTRTDLEAGRVDGRVEHVMSGQTAQFHSVGELIEIMKAVLKEPQTKAHEEGSRVRRYCPSVNYKAD